MSLTRSQRLPLLASGLLGLTGVALGALGAHKLQPLLEQRGMAAIWETAARYHLYHALALLAVAALVRDPGAAVVRRLTVATWFWIVGVVLFSGSLYWFSVGGPFPLVYVTPIGGISLLIGWAFVIAAAFGRENATRG